MNDNHLINLRDKFSKCKYTSLVNYKPDDVFDRPKADLGRLVFCDDEDDGLSTLCRFSLDARKADASACRLTNFS